MKKTIARLKTVGYFLKNERNKYPIILKDVKTRMKNVLMLWIDYKKAYATNMDNRISEIIQNIKASHKRLRKSYGKLESKTSSGGGDNRGKKKIQRDIFQGDSLSEKKTQI